MIWNPTSVKQGLPGRSRPTLPAGIGLDTNFHTWLTRTSKDRIAAEPRRGFEGAPGAAIDSLELAKETLGYMLPLLRS